MDVSTIGNYQAALSFCQSNSSDLTTSGAISEDLKKMCLLRKHDSSVVVASPAWSSGSRVLILDGYGGYEPPEISSDLDLVICLAPYSLRSFTHSVVTVTSACPTFPSAVHAFLHGVLAPVLRQGLICIDLMDLRAVFGRSRRASLGWYACNDPRVAGKRTAELLRRSGLGPISGLLVSEWQPHSHISLFGAQAVADSLADLLAPDCLFLATPVPAVEIEGVIFALAVQPLD